MPLPGGRPLAALCVLASLLAGAAPGTAAAQPAPGSGNAAPAPWTKEYLHQQPADTALVFRFESFEAEFESRIAEAGRAPFKVSGIPGLRLGPVFQFVEAVAKPRELVIDVALGRRSDRARIDMQLVRFDRSGPDQETLQKAYRLLSHGLEAAPPDRLDLWQQKIMSLKQAAMWFDRLGMQEPRLWAEFYAGHFLLERLGDALTAAEDARLLQAEAERSRHALIVLAALQLEGRALLTLGAAGGKPAIFDRARAVLQAAAARAAEMDHQHERALALFHVGLADERQNRYEEAFAKFDEALRVASLAEDTDLANALRRHAAELHERLGDTAAAIAILQRIESRTADAGTATEAAPDAPPPKPDPARRDTVRYLYEQGRLLVKAARHTEAVDVLRRGLALARAEPGGGAEGPVGLLLGQALYETGRFDEAAAQLAEAIPRTAASAHAESLFAAWGALAAIQRHRGETGAVAVSREQQAKFAASPDAEALLAYQLGLDALGLAEPDYDSARGSFRDSARLAGAAGRAALATLSRWQRCAIGDGGCGGGLAPTGAGMDAADALELQRLQVEVQRRAGRTADAAASATRLLDGLLRHRAESPDLLGAWYWLRRDAVFDTFAELHLLHAGAGADTAVLTLAALDALRAPPDSAATTGLGGRARQLRDRLDRLDETESLVAWYVSGSRAHAWLGHRSELRLVPLRWDAARSAALAEAVENLRSDAAAGNTAAVHSALERLGEALLGPLAGQLREVVLFLPLGPLEGLPLDALPWRGRPLATSHRVVNLISLARTGEPVSGFSFASPNRVFLAGNRQEGAGDFATPTPQSAEIRMLAARFTGPGLTLRQGAALQADEFRDETFTGAGLLHLAMPAIENLKDPRGSQLLMSDNSDEPDDLVLLAPELPSPLKAGLAVLSRAEFTGTGTPLQRGATLVDALLARGVGAVVVSLWPVGDDYAAEFMEHFYALLAETGHVDRALAGAKLRQLRKDDAIPPHWAAFQLFVD